MSEFNAWLILGTAFCTSVLTVSTEALIAKILVAKYADHLPLYRQPQIFARQGIELDRSTQADWGSRAAWYLRPLRDHILE